MVHPCPTCPGLGRKVWKGDLGSGKARSLPCEALGAGSWLGRREQQQQLEQLLVACRRGHSASLCRGAGFPGEIRERPTSRAVL